MFFLHKNSFNTENLKKHIIQIIKKSNIDNIKIENQLKECINWIYNNSDIFAINNLIYTINFMKTSEKLN